MDEGVAGMLIVAGLGIAACLIACYVLQIGIFDKVNAETSWDTMCGKETLYDGSVSGELALGIGQTRTFYFTQDDFEPEYVSEMQLHINSVPLLAYEQPLEVYLNGVRINDTRWSPGEPKLHIARDKTALVCGLNEIRVKNIGIPNLVISKVDIGMHAYHAYTSSVCDIYIQDSCTDAEEHRGCVQPRWSYLGDWCLPEGVTTSTRATTTRATTTTTLCSNCGPTTTFACIGEGCPKNNNDGIIIACLIAIVTGVVILMGAKRR